jgi:hypothetical protein
MVFDAHEDPIAVAYKDTIRPERVSRDTTACRASRLLTPSRNPNSIPEYDYANYCTCIDLK